jgi:hypothetical protein
MFATATELCEWTGIPLPDNLGRLQQLLSSASALIQAYCGQDLVEVTDDQVMLHPDPSWSVFLPQAPVTDVSAITVDTVPVTGFTFTQAGEITRTDGGWFEGTVLVTYTHGYPESSSEFRQVRSVCIEMTKRAYTADEAGQALFQGGIPAETVGFPTALFLTESEQMMLPNPAPAAVG